MQILQGKPGEVVAEVGVVPDQAGNIIPVDLILTHGIVIVVVNCGTVVSFGSTAVLGEDIHIGGVAAGGLTAVAAEGAVSAPAGHFSADIADAERAGVRAVDSGSREEGQEAGGRIALPGRGHEGPFGARPAGGLRHEPGGVADRAGLVGGVLRDHQEVAGDRRGARCGTRLLGEQRALESGVAVHQLGSVGFGGLEPVEVGAALYRAGVGGVCGGVERIAGDGRAVLAGVGNVDGVVAEGGVRGGKHFAAHSAVHQADGAFAVIDLVGGHFAVRVEGIVPGVACLIVIGVGIVDGDGGEGLIPGAADGAGTQGLAVRAGLPDAGLHAALCGGRDQLEPSVVVKIRHGIEPCVGAAVLLERIKLGENQVDLLGSGFVAGTDRGCPGAETDAHEQRQNQQKRKNFFHVFFSFFYFFGNAESIAAHVLTASFPSDSVSKS